MININGPSLLVTLHITSSTCCHYLQFLRSLGFSLRSLGFHLLTRWRFDQRLKPDLRTLMNNTHQDIRSVSV